jgi:hypothetical protein
MQAAILAVLMMSGPAYATDARPEATVATLWRAMSNAPGKSADALTLHRIFHEDAVIFGSRYKNADPVLRRSEAKKFLEAFGQAEETGFYECEIARTMQVHDRFATVYSVVESRTDAAAKAPDFVGVNSLQLYRVGQDWKILSLYYHVGPTDMPVPKTTGKSGKCLD